MTTPAATDATDPPDAKKIAAKMMALSTPTWLGKPMSKEDVTKQIQYLIDHQYDTPRYHKHEDNLKALVCRFGDNGYENEILTDENLKQAAINLADLRSPHGNRYFDFEVDPLFDACDWEGDSAFRERLVRSLVNNYYPSAYHLGMPICKHAMEHDAHLRKPIVEGLCRALFEIPHDRRPDDYEHDRPKYHFEHQLDEYHDCAKLDPEQLASFQKKIFDELKRVMKRCERVKDGRVTEEEYATVQTGVEYLKSNGDMASLASFNFKRGTKDVDAVSKTLDEWKKRADHWEHLEQALELECEAKCAADRLRDRKRPAEEGANEEGGFKKRRMRALASKTPTGVDVFIQEQWSTLPHYEEDPDWERKWDELSRQEQGVYCYRAWRLSAPDAEFVRGDYNIWVE